MFAWIRRIEFGRWCQANLVTAQPVPRAVALKKEGATSMVAPDVIPASKVPPSAVATAPYEARHIKASREVSLDSLQISVLLRV